jgi:hypothetical protein
MKIASMLLTKCSRCEGDGWICVQHPEHPWNGPGACGCGRAGVPCPSCNAEECDDLPKMPKGFKATEVSDESLFFHSADRATHDRVIGSACVAIRAFRLFGISFFAKSEQHATSASALKGRHPSYDVGRRLRHQSVKAPLTGAVSANFLVAVPAIRLPRSETLPSCDPT